MAESTLNLSLNSYLAQVGNYLGWGFGSTAQTGYGDVSWSTFQANEVSFCVASGLRQFYFPSPSYDWTFLHPTTTLTLQANINVLNLPDDFGGLEGYMTVTSALTPTSAYNKVPVIYEGILRQRYQCQPTITGPPTLAALQPIKGTTQVSSTRDQLFVFPIPDQNYVVQFQYYVLPDMLSGTNPYVYGGAQHAETILQSCLSVAEFRKDNVIGPNTAMFKERMQASMGADRKLKPQQFGRNKDMSDSHWYRGNPHGNVPLNTYNGGSIG